MQQSDVMDMYDWSRLSKFQIHPDKSEVLEVKASHLKKHLAFNLKLAEKNINVVSAHKHLGVVLDEFWTFSAQVDKVVKSAFAAWHSFRNSFPRLAWQTYLLAYKTYVLPIIEYSNLGYFPSDGFRAH